MKIWPKSVLNWLKKQKKTEKNDHKISDTWVYDGKILIKKKIDMLKW